MRLRKSDIYYYLIGILILTLGISIAIRSNQGTSPFDALLVGLFKTFGFSIGSFEVIVGFTMILINSVVTKERPEYFALVTSLITGVGIDFWYYVTGYLTFPSAFAGELFVVSLGVIISALGISIYIQSSIAPNPLDRSMLILSDKTGLSLTKSRAIINVILVIIAFSIGGVIGIGTVINALLSGWLITLFLPHISFISKYDTKGGEHE